MDSDYLQLRHRRARSALRLVLLGLGVLVLVFFHEQVVHAPGQQVPAGGRLRAYTVPAPRGLMLDRHGAVLAETTPGYAIVLAPMAPDSARRTLRQLAPYLALSEPEISALLARQRLKPRQRLVISHDAPLDMVAAIAERAPALPNVAIEAWPKRHYPAGAAAAHVVGTVGPPLETARAARANGEPPPDRLVGATGLERQYDARLGGRNGLRYVQTDSRGRTLGAVRLRQEVEPLPGQTLRLSLDLGLQQTIARALPGEERAAVAALDPRTGEVLALYSSPSFDPNRVAGPAFHDRWMDLLEADGSAGLARSIAGTYQPGPVWAVATAATALRLELASGETVMPLSCRGGISYADRYLPCSDRHGHGSLSLSDALAQRCDVYFYQLGLQVGLDRLLIEGARLGFGRSTGIDLPGERAGLVPENLTTYARTLGVAPAEHEAMLVAAGKGLIEVSPLKLAHFFAALTTGGPAPAPRLLHEGAGDGRDGGLELPLSLDQRQRLRDALRLQPREPLAWEWSGTGGAAGHTAAGHDWFVGVAGPPGQEAQFVIAVVVEGGRADGTAARIGELALEHVLRSATEGRPLPAD
jgi:penicillin-binding protein 2